MAVRLCPNAIACPGTDFPVTNYSAEGAEDAPRFYSLIFPRSWDAMGCLNLCTSDVSQAAADECALQQLADCQQGGGGGNSTDGGVGGPTGGSRGDGLIFSPQKKFISGPAQCEVFCPDGSPFIYNVPAGLFSAQTQSQADALAKAYACDKADANIICLDEIVPTSTCANVPYSATVEAVSAQTTAITFTLSGGQLPPGLNLSSTPTGFLINGTPTTAGTYDFTVRASDVSGTYMEKGYTLYILGFSTQTVPDATASHPYSFQFQVSGYEGQLSGSGVYTVALYSGGLPSGLSIDLNGLLSGTPALGSDGTYPFTLQVTDLTANISCLKNFTLVVRASEPWIDLVWGPLIVVYDKCSFQLAQHFEGGAFGFSGTAEAYYDPPGCHATCPPGPGCPGGCWPGGYDASRLGTASYTGPALNCAIGGSGTCFQNVGGGFAQIYLTVWQNGIVLAQCTFFSTPAPPNSQNIQLFCPFTLAAGVNSPIMVRVEWLFDSQSCGSSETLGFSGFITNL